MKPEYKRALGREERHVHLQRLPHLETGKERVQRLAALLLGIIILIMFLQKGLQSLFTLTTLPSAVWPMSAHHQRCKAGDPCWPSVSEWEAFNSSINGKLIQTYPSAASC